MVYLLKIVIFHGELLNNQMVVDSGASATVLSETAMKLGKSAMLSEEQVKNGPCF
jgi:hypothetical protein